MDNGNGLGVADVAALSGGGFGGLGNGLEGLLYLAVIAFMFGGGNFLGGGNPGNANAIQADVNRGFDNQNLQAQTRDLMGAVTSGTAQTIAASTQNASNAITAIKDGNAALIREFGNVETALTALGGKQQECCCGILRAIDGVNYNGALNTAAINANVTAQVQGIKDLLVAQHDQEQQARIQQLELEKAMSGVLRFPNQWTFGAGPFPPIFGGCCGNV